MRGHLATYMHAHDASVANNKAQHTQFKKRKFTTDEIVLLFDALRLSSHTPTEATISAHKCKRAP